MSVPRNVSVINYGRRRNAAARAFGPSRLSVPKRVLREGRAVRRMLSKSQLVYLRMEAKGLTTLPIATRRRVAQAVEREPAIDLMMLSKESVIQIEFKSTRKEVDTALRRLAQAVRMVELDPEIMHGTAVYRGGA